ncbi:hypothetical protein BH11PSE3_BH11PSE3_32310 [soil metagenome]
MSIAEIDRFAADLKSNDALRADARTALGDQSHATEVDRVIAFGASKGYAFTADELKEHIKATADAAGRKLTDAELDGVAGGLQNLIDTYSRLKDTLIVINTAHPPE